MKCHFFFRSIRALYGTDDQKNAVHGSDSQFSAEREIRFMFTDSKLTLSNPRNLCFMSSLFSNKSMPSMLVPHPKNILYPATRPTVRKPVDRKTFSGWWVSPWLIGFNSLCELFSKIPKIFVFQSLLTLFFQHVLQEITISIAGRRDFWSHCLFSLKIKYRIR